MAEISTLNIAFIHGWAGFPDQWEELADSLRHLGHISFLGTDYFSDKEETESTQSPKSFDIVIAHSFGFRWMVERGILASKGFILLSPLLSFEKDSLQFRSTKRMIKMLPTNKMVVLDQFFQNGGFIPGKSAKRYLSKMRLNALLRDLEVMTSPINKPLQISAECHIFRATTDNIVPQSWKSNGSDCTDYSIESGNHFLFIEPQVSKQIKFIIEHLSHAN